MRRQQLAAFVYNVNSTPTCAMKIFNLTLILTEKEIGRYSGCRKMETCSLTRAFIPSKTTGIASRPAFAFLLPCLWLHQQIL